MLSVFVVVFKTCYLEIQKLKTLMGIEKPVNNNKNLDKRQYEITIGTFTTCTCMDFVTMISSSLGKQGKWVLCKHMYYVLQHVMFCGEFEIFIHFLTRIMMKFIAY
jgi:hypothetical protein